jgi:hypothetical protein
LWGRCYTEKQYGVCNSNTVEKENKVLSFLAIVLTLVQIVPLMYAIIEYVFLSKISFAQFLTALSACGLTAAATLLIVFLLKKLK